MIGWGGEEVGVAVKEGERGGGVLGGEIVAAVEIRGA